MNFKLLTAILLMIVHSSGYAKTPRNDFEGKVVDESGASLPYVNVVLLSPSDSTFVAGVTSNEKGEFTITTAEKKGIVRLSSVGFNTLYINLADYISNSTITMSSIQNELGEVVVKAMLPKSKLTGNGILTTVEGTVLSATGNLDEMLAKVPGMTQNGENLEVIGKGSPIVYINGRLMRDATELQRLRSDEVRDIEVINNPGAQYDATVKAVVRVRTIRRKGDGFGFDINATNQFDLRYAFHTPSIQLNANYRHNSFDIFGSTTFWDRDSRLDAWLEETTYAPSRTFHQQGPYMMSWKRYGFNHSLGGNWQITPDHSVGVRIDLTNQLYQLDQTGYNEDIMVNGTLVDHVNSLQRSNHDTPLSWLTNAYYNGKIGSLGIDFNIDYYRNVNDTRRATTEHGLNSADDIVRYNTTARSNLFAAKLILSQPLLGGNLEFGSEMTFARQRNTYVSAHERLSNTNAHIAEDNISAFIEYKRSFDKVGDATIGVRYEHTSFDYDDRMGNDDLHRPLDRVFPVASFSTTLGKVQTSLAYSVKTVRPDYFALNDATNYLSRFTYQVGNTKLKNSTLQELTLNVIYKWLTFSASYEHDKDNITQWPILGEGDIVILKHMNMPQPIQTVSAFISATPTVGVWSLNATVGAQKQYLWLDLEGAHLKDGKQRLHFNKPIGIVNLYNTFRLKHEWQFEANMQFSSKGHTQNYFEDYNSIRLGAVVQKQFLNKALTLRMAVTDILQRSYSKSSGDYGYYTIQQNDLYTRHKLYMNLVYRFNTTRSKYKGTGAGKEAQNRMRT